MHIAHGHAEIVCQRIIERARNECKFQIQMCWASYRCPFTMRLAKWRMSSKMSFCAQFSTTTPLNDERRWCPSSMRALDLCRMKMWFAVCTYNLIST